MTQQQQGDVLLYQTDNDGDIDVVDGLVAMSGGLQTAAYLSMFGGNRNDDGMNDSRLTWWGNFDENQQSYQYRSETQYLLGSIVAVPANLRRIEEAVKRDCAWFVIDNVASEVNATVTMPGLNRVKIVVNINAMGDEQDFTFIENWKVNIL